MRKYLTSTRLKGSLTGIGSSKATLQEIQKSVEWATPKEFYEQINKEFEFDFDPCPIDSTNRDNGIFSEWGQRNFVNPPYNKAVTGWLNKGLLERAKGKLVVFLLPVRTDVAWFHDYVLPHADEIRFVRGRLFFGAKRTHPAPFPSMLVIYRPKETPSEGASTA
jgi:hypothetical protein